MTSAPKITGRRRRAPRSAQRGVVLLIALILLIALTIGGIALFRQVSTGVLIASNLTYRNGAVVASDRGVEVARNWLVTGGANLQQASLANAYFPGWCNISVNAGNLPDADGNGVTDDCKAAPPPSTFDPLTYNWTNSVLATADDGNGNAVRYVIHRLCRIPGSLSFTNSDNVPQECVTASAAAGGGGSEIISYGGGALTTTIRPYYRITTQTTGPRNTVVYSQIIMY